MSINFKETQLLKIYNWLVILFPFAILAKQIAVIFHMITAIIVFFYYIYSVKHKIILNGFFKIAMILSLYLILRSIFSQHPIVSLSKSCTLLIYVIFSLTLLNINLHKIQNKLFVSIAMFLAVLSVDGLVQMIFGTDFLNNRKPLSEDYLRINGPFSGVGFSSTLALFLLPLLNIIPITNKKILKIIYSLVVILSIIMIILSGERSGLYILIIGTITSFLLNHNIPKPYYIFALLCMVCFFIMLAFKNLSTRYKLTLENILNSEYVTQWKHGILIFKENFIFGIGSHQYNKYCNTAIDPLCRHKHPHSVYIEMLLDSGIIGSSIFVLMLFLLLRSCYHCYKYTNNSKRHSLFVAIITPIIARIFFFPSNVSFMKYAYAAPFWFMVGLLFCFINTYECSHAIKKQ